MDELRQVLADAWLAGPWDEAGLLERAHLVLALDGEPHWFIRLARRALRAYREPPYDRRQEFHGWLEHQLRRLPEETQLPAVRGRLLPVAEMGRMRWPVPEIPSLAGLAAHLDLHPGELEWLADTRGLEHSVSAEKLRNYRYRWIPRDGGLPRLLEIPKRLLKETQRRVLHELLDHIPPHPDAHGFRPGHSPLTNASRHVGSGVVIGFDLEDFFASVSGGRIYGIFRGAGYPETVAHRLTALCTNVVPAGEWRSVPATADHLLARRHRLGRRLAAPHLPQGAPTSAALANLAAFGLDRRLAALAAGSGARYSRYADDLTFSGDRRLLASAVSFRRLVGEIVRDEGFRLNERKSRLASRAGRQVVTGIVVNERPNLARHEYDRLRAVLHDAVVNGPERANRAGLPDLRSHLLGRIAWAESIAPARGAKLRAVFSEISW